MIVDTSKLRRHNCAGCVYTGSNAKADVYIHDHHIVVRYGNKPWERAAYLASEIHTLPRNTEHLETFLYVGDLLRRQVKSPDDTFHFEELTVVDWGPKQ